MLCVSYDPNRKNSPSTFVETQIMQYEAYLIAKHACMHTFIQEQCSEQKCSCKLTVAIDVHQKSQESVLLIDCMPCGSSDSNRQILSPFSLISFHHRRPTISLPVTFFTVQKSRAKRIMMTTKLMTNDLEKSPHKIYAAIAPPWL